MVVVLQCQLSAAVLLTMRMLGVPAAAGSLPGGGGDYIV